jgi:hypothetical protein
VRVIARPARPLPASLHHVERPNGHRVRGPHVDRRRPADVEDDVPPTKWPRARRMPHVPSPRRVKEPSRSQRTRGTCPRIHPTKRKPPLVHSSVIPTLPGP